MAAGDLVRDDRDGVRAQYWTMVGYQGPGRSKCLRARACGDYCGEENRGDSALRALEPLGAAHYRGITIFIIYPTGVTDTGAVPGMNCEKGWTILFEP
jgi:hypothetical protein